MTAARIARRKATRLARRSSAGGDPARLVAPHPWLMQPPSNASTPFPLASSPRQPPSRGHANSARPIHHPNHARRGQIPIAPAAPPALHLPRFRALALFRRLPSARVDGVVMQASENLHNPGHRGALIAARVERNIELAIPTVSIPTQQLPTGTHRPLDVLAHVVLRGICTKRDPDYVSLCCLPRGLAGARVRTGRPKVSQLRRISQQRHQRTH